MYRQLCESCQVYDFLHSHKCIDLDIWGTDDHNVYVNRVNGKWYWMDETSALTGPYATKKSAKIDLDQYRKSLG